MALLLVSLTGLFIRIAQGPVVLDALIPRLEAMATEALSVTDGAGVHGLRIGGAQIDLGDPSAPAPGLYATDVVLHDAEGAVIVTMPAVRLSLRPFDAIQGEFRLSAVSLLRPRLRLPAAPGLSAGPARDPAAALRSPARLAALLEAAPTWLGTLGRVSLRDAVIEIPASDGSLQVIEGVSLTLRRNQGTIAADGTVPLPGGGAVLIEANRGQDGQVAATVTLRDMPSAALASLHPALAPLRDIDAPLGGMLWLSLSPDGTVESARVSAALGPGRVPTMAGQAPVSFEALEVTAALDAAAGQVSLDRLVLRSALGRLEASGTVEPVIEDGQPAGAIVVLSLGETMLPLGLPEGGAPPALARFDGGSLVARLQGDPEKLELAELFLRRGPLTLSASGALTMADAGSARLTGLIRDLSVADLKRLWPPQAAPGALRWVREHLEAGRVDEARFNLSGPIDKPAFALDFAFRDAVARPLPPLPPLSGRGWGSVSADGFSLTLAEGETVIPGDAGGRIALDGSSFHIDDLGAEPIPARITVLADGAASAILSLIDSEPLTLLDTMPLAPAAVGGAAQVTARLTVPLLRDLKLEQVGVTAEATLRDTTLSLAALRPGLILTADRLALQADVDRLRLQGAGRAGETALDLDWQEEFAPQSGEPRSRLALAGSLDPATLGIRTLPEGVTLDRPLPVRMTLIRDDAPGAGFSVEADLARATLEIPALAWSKPRGGAGQVTARGRWTPGGTRIDALSLRAAGLALRASLQLGPDGTVERLEAERLRIGERTDIALSLTRGPAGLDGTVTGEHLDASGLLALNRESISDGSAPPAVLRFDIAHARLDDRRAMHHAVGQLNRDGHGAVHLSLAGSLNGAAPVTLDLMRQTDGQGRVTVRSSDAGGLLRAGGLFRRGIGGSLRAEARLLPAADGAMHLTGEASIEGIVVGEDGALDQLLTRAQLDEALTRLEQEGIRFDRVHAPFQWQGGRLTVVEAVAHGPTVGITVSGDYDSGADRLAMQGVFTPLYGLNSLIGHVPLLGPLLTGGEGQGLIALNFTLSGPAGAPEVSVNPLSALLPGVLRQIIQPRLAPG